MDTKRRVSTFQTAYERQRAKQELVLEQLHTYRRKLTVVESQLNVYTKVMRLLQLTSEYAREQMVKRIEYIVTNALTVVFGHTVEFKVELGVRAGQPTAEFYVIDGDRQDKPMEARGGGLVDIVSTALRLAVLELYEPKIEGPVVLDEPGKMISADYIENFAYFLKEYSNQTGRQIIMITHNNTLAGIADKSFKVHLEGKRSVVNQ